LLRRGACMLQHACRVVKVASRSPVCLAGIAGPQRHVEGVALFSPEYRYITVHGSNGGCVSNPSGGNAVGWVGAAAKPRVGSQQILHV